MHRKKTISWILSVVTVLSVFFLNFGSITVNAVNKSADDAINWCKSLLGHAIDVDKCYGAQCVDLIMAYYDYLVGYHVSGNGEDYASNKYPSEDGWTRTQGGTPQKGDILVYVDNSTYVENGVTKQRVGHVAIYESDYSTYHQNYNGQYVRNITNTIYSKACRATAYYWGCIHPNFNGSTVSPTPVSSWYDMPDGEYEIFSKSTGKALNAFCNNGQARQGTKITVAPSSHSVDQKFKIEGLDTQKHYIRCLSNSNLFYLDVYADNVYSGAEAHLWSYSSNPTKQWYFKDEGNGDFSIRCVSNSNLALTVTNEVPYNDQLRVRVQDWNGSDAQKWRLEGNVPRPSYQLDLNSYVDGEKKWDLAGVATADVYINGTLVADDCNDFCATYVEGTRYKIVISTKAGYNIVDKTSYEGSLTGPINIEPSFVKILYPLDLNSYIDGVERDCLGGV
ncbi:MAG: RICIN domain-containing protein, partial [Clostridia bacterium]|nr:RICIN domain-containing protein [Clostridia bacterium]